MLRQFNLQLLFVIYASLAQNPLTVTIPQGVLQGKEISLIRTQRIYAFLGIPYAEPPLEFLRFQPPQIENLPSWNGTRNATEFAKPCLQAEEYKSEDMAFLGLITEGPIDSSEDCLYLNVFVPYGIPPPEGFTVIVWIHPGNFTSGDPKIWNPYTLVHRQGIIFVTMAYRLNVMGFFTSLDGEAPGNFGLLDQQAAMSWVKNNIQSFGGNPNNICLMGYGAGATSVALHMINPDSRGLFSKAIIMSGGIFNANALRTNNKVYEEFLDDLVTNFGCFRTPTNRMMECLRKVESKKIVQYTIDFNWRPLIESADFYNSSRRPFITEPLKNYFVSGNFEKIPLLTGYTNMEHVLRLSDLIQQDLSVNASEEYLFNLLPEMASWDLPPINESDNCLSNPSLISDSIMFCYKPTLPLKETDVLRRLVIDFATEKDVAASTFLHASYMSNANQETYMYRFDMKPSTPIVLERLPPWASVPHLFDLIYVWGIPYWASSPSRQTWDVRDKRTSDIIMLFWTNFAKYSNPAENFPYPIRWDRFTTENPGILIIDRTFNMSDHTRLNYKAFEFWNEYYPKVVEIATQCCNATDSSESVHKFNDFIMYLFSFYLIYVY